MDARYVTPNGKVANAGYADSAGSASGWTGTAYIKRSGAAVITNTKMSGGDVYKYTAPVTGIFNVFVDATVPVGTFDVVIDGRPMRECFIAGIAFVNKGQQLKITYNRSSSTQDLSIVMVTLPVIVQS